MFFVVVEKAKFIFTISAEELEFRFTISAGRMKRMGVFEENGI